MNLWVLIKQLKNPGNAAQMVRGAGGGILVRCLSAVFTFALAAIMTNLMGSVEYGIYTFIVVWLNFLVLAGSLGFHRSAVRYISSYTALQQWDLLRGFLQFGKRRVLLASIGIAVVSLIFLFISRDYLENKYGEGFMWASGFAGMLLIFLAQLQLQIGFLDGFKKVVLSQVPLQIVRPVLISLAMLGLAFAFDIPLTASVVMLITLVATVFVLGLSTHHLAGAIPPESAVITPKEEANEWLRTSGEMMLASGFSLTLMQVDILMMGILVDTTQGGIYHIASKLAGLLIIANVAVNSILYPMVADLYTKKATDELQRLISLAANIVMGLGILSGGVLFAGAEFILAFFGPEFIVAALPLRVFIAGIMINLLTGPGLLVLNMTGHQRDGMWVMGAVAVMNVMLNAWLIPKWGALGAATATSISLGCYNLVAAIYAWYRVKIVTMAFRFR